MVAGVSMSMLILGLSHLKNGQVSNNISTRIIFLFLLTTLEDVPTTAVVTVSATSVDVPATVTSKVQIARLENT